MGVVKCYRVHCVGPDRLADGQLLTITVTVTVIDYHRPAALDEIGLNGLDNNTDEIPPVPDVSVASKYRNTVVLTDTQLIYFECGQNTLDEALTTSIRVHSRALKLILLGGYQTRAPVVSLLPLYSIGMVWVRSRDQEQTHADGDH